jgi:hypothetical protein
LKNEERSDALSVLKIELQWDIQVHCIVIQNISVDIFHDVTLGIGFLGEGLKHHIQ